MPDKVIDASVMAAWCFREGRRREALEAMSGSELCAPTLLAYELANIAWKKAQGNPEGMDNLRQGLEEALALPIRWLGVDHVAVWRIALDSNLSAYDASYLYLARILGAPLVTFDQRLQRAARGY